MCLASFSYKYVSFEAHSRVFSDCSEVMVPFRTPKSLVDFSLCNIVVFYIFRSKLIWIVGLYFAEFLHLGLKK